MIGKGKTRFREKGDWVCACEFKEKGWWGRGPDGKERSLCGDLLLSLELVVVVLLLPTLPGYVLLPGSWNKLEEAGWTFGCAGVKRDCSSCRWATAAAAAAAALDWSLKEPRRSESTGRFS